MEYRNWKILKVLFEQKNITRTAEILYISQPALTKRLQQIEKDFGVQIILRRRRGIHFTPQGEYLVKCADDMLKKFQEINDNITNMDDKVTGTLRIGASYLITRTKLPKLLKLFKDQYPEVEFKVTTGWSEQVYQSLINEDVQVGFLRGDYKWQEGKSKLLHEPLTLIYHKDVNIKDLPNLPRIDYNSDSKLKEMINNWWSDNFSVPPIVSMTVDKSDTCKEMVISGLGYAIIPGYVMNGSEDLYKIELSNKKGEPIVRVTWMFYHEESLNLKLVKAFTGFVNEIDFEKV